VSTDLGGGFSIRLSADHMAAYLCGLASAADAGIPVTAAQVMTALAAKKVSHGIDSQRIDTLIAALNNHTLADLPACADDVATATGSDYCIAVGEPSRPGTDAVLRWHVEHAATAATARVVLAGEPLATLLPAGDGSPGCTVAGKPISARSGQRVSLLAGPGVDVVRVAEGEQYCSRWLGVAEFDGRAVSVDPRIVVSIDAMSAHMDVFARSAAGTRIEADAVVAALVAQGVAAGIDAAAIAAALAHAASQGSGMTAQVLVARGMPSQPGKNAHLAINHKDAVVGRLLPHGRIDFHERDYPWNVRAGDGVGYLIDARPGIDGYSVRGDVLPAAPVKVLALTLDGLIRETRGKLVVQRDGALILDGLCLTVTELLVLAGDLDQQTGNVRCELPAHVKGHVTAGYALECGKDVIVDHNIEDAVVRAGGSITIKGGVRGAASRVFSPHNISVGFVESAVVLANGDIDVARSVINSELTANGSVRIGRAKSAQGTLMGGTTRAREVVEVAILGAPTYAHTQVIVGHSSEIREAIEELDDQLQGCRNELTQLQQLEQRLFEHPREQRDVLLPKILATRTEVQTRIALLEPQREALLASALQDAQARVIVRRQCHPGVQIVIHERRYEVTLALGAGTFVFDTEADAVVFAPG